MEGNNKKLVISSDQCNWFSEEISIWLESRDFDQRNGTADGIINVLRFLLETQAENVNPKPKRSVYQQKIDEVASGKFEF